MQGFERFPSPRELAARRQAVGNERFPPPGIARRLQDVPADRRIDVWVRIEWERDGEEVVAGVAFRWDRHHVLVRINDERLQIGMVWVAPHDVRRRTDPQVSGSE